MARDLTSGWASATVAASVRIAMAIEAEFSTGTVRVWSGAATLAWNSLSWTALGHLIGVDRIEESQAVSANGVAITLSGVPSSLINLALNDDYRGKPVRIWILLMDADFDTVVESYLQFAGRMDTMTFEDAGETTSFSMQCESNLVDLQRPRIVRYTDEEQQRLHPGDLGLQYVAALAEKPLYWGIPPT
jgi:hypothetical protein